MQNARIHVFICMYIYIYTMYIHVLVNVKTQIPRSEEWEDEMSMSSDGFADYMFIQDERAAAESDARYRLLCKRSMNNYSINYLNL